MIVCFQQARVVYLIGGYVRVKLNRKEVSILIGSKPLVSHGFDSDGWVKYFVQKVQKFDGWKADKN